MTKREKILSLMQVHKSLFEKENVNNPKFIPRLCYKHNDQKIVSFYPRELYGGVDIYIEFCDRDYNPEDPNRTLWKWINKSDFDKLYELSEPHHATNDKRYLIPISELVNVTEFHNNQIEIEETVTNDTIEKTDEFLADVFDDGGMENDIPASAMTLRDYIAIKWKKPVSHKKWLNELITKYNP